MCTRHGYHVWLPNKMNKYPNVTKLDVSSCHVPLLDSESQSGWKNAKNDHWSFVDINNIEDIDEKFVQQ